MSESKQMGRGSRILFLLCWISYFSTYIGRQNYSAVMADIIQSEGYLNRTCGLIGTGFFICYGAGQIVSGFLGDRFSPKWLIFTGISVSAAVNGVMSLLHSPEAMVAAWCLNGAAQSMTWSPILRVFSEYLPEDQQKKACVNIATTYPAAVFLTYPMCSALVYGFGWRSVFVVTSVFMATVSLLWLGGFSWIEKVCDKIQTTDGPQSASDKKALPLTSSLILLLLLISGSLIIQGALRDGITNWVPAYLCSTYDVGTFIAIFATSVLPFINLFGVYAANFVFAGGKRNEVRTSAVLFFAAFLSLVCLCLTEGSHLLISLLFFSLATSCMMGINVMLVSFVPTNFIRWGRVSTISGLLNSTVYIGSSIATYGLGAVADIYGWSMLIKCLSVSALVGILLCILAEPKWRKFLKEEESM